LRPQVSTYPPQPQTAQQPSQRHSITSTTLPSPQSYEPASYSSHHSHEEVYHTDNQSYPAFSPQHEYSSSDIVANFRIYCKGMQNQIRAFTKIQAAILIQIRLHYPSPSRLQTLLTATPLIHFNPHNHFICLPAPCPNQHIRLFKHQLQRSLDHRYPLLHQLVRVSMDQ
jgi:hypothetical protein